MVKGIMAEMPKKEHPRVIFNLCIPKEHALYKSFSMKNLGVGKPHSLSLHGRITSLREDENEKFISFEVNGIGEKGKAKGESVGDIIRGLHEKKEKNSEGV